MSLPKVRSKDQREDLLIVDSIRSYLRVKNRAALREQEDQAFSVIVPKIEAARSEGAAIDLNAFMDEAWQDMKQLTLGDPE